MPPASAHYRSNAQRAGTTNVNPDKVHKVMREFKQGKLHSGSKHGSKVRSRAQAVAIALSEARKRG